MAREPIAVAFVEVRPEVENFQAEAERELLGTLGQEGLDIRGRVQLEGISEARQDVEALTGELQGITGQQLQFAGLDDAVRSTDLLAQNLGEAAQVDLAQNLRPAAEAARSLGVDVEAFATGLSGLQSVGNVGGFTEAKDDVEALNDEVEQLDENLSGAAQTAGGIADASRLVQPAIRGGSEASNELAEGFAEASASSTETARTVDEITNAMEGLVRVGGGVGEGGPFRMLDIDPDSADRISDAANEVERLEDVLRDVTEDKGFRQILPTDIADEQRELASARERLTEVSRRASFVTQGDAAAQTRHAATTRIDSVATRQAILDDEAFIRVRARRSAAVGAFRLAGVGVGVGAALFTATRALGDASNALRVTGDEASTTGGKLRNFAAGVLSGDVVGAFSALTNTTRSYTQAQLIAINRTPGLTKQLKSMGEGANIARSQLAALTKLADIPQFLQTAESRLNAGDAGDSARLANLERQGDAIKRQIATARQLGVDQNSLNQLLESLNNKQREIDDKRDAIAEASEKRAVSRLRELVTDAELGGDVDKIIAALKREAAHFRRLIDAEGTSADDRQKAKNDLQSVHAEIEATQDEIVAEEERHRQAMLDKLLDVGVLEDLEAQVGGGAGGAGRSRRAAAIEATLARGTIDGKRLTRAEKERLNAELIAINSEIEAEQDNTIAENERHASAMQQKLDDADQAFIEAIGGREQRLRNAQLVASATATLADDIRVSEALQRTFRESIAAARKTIAAARLRAETISELTQELLREEESERSLRQQRRSERIARREESLDLNIQIAQANDNTAAELRAHRAKIKFLQERIRHTREGTNQRKRLILELRQEQAAVRDLLKAGKDEAKETGASFAELAAAFLQERQGFLTNLAGNLLPRGTTLGSGTTRAEPTQRPPAAPRPADEAVPSPLARGAARGDEGGPLAAQRLRDEARGAPANQSQAEELIFLSKQQVRLLRDLKAGLGHTEAATSRSQSKHAGSGVSVD